jgi:hypothetical protein
MRDDANLIWLWPSASGYNHLLPPSNYYREQIHAFLDDTFSKNGLTREDKKPLKLRLSDCRDIYALFFYQNSGFNHLLTARALGQSSLSSLLHYLEKKQLRIQDRIRLIKLYGMVLVDLAGRKYNPRHYREPLLNQAVTGLICTDNLHPDPRADPGNPGGRPCRSQNCPLCFNWLATIESVPFLIRMVVDLELIRDSMGLVLWEASSYPEDMEIYKYIISQFHPSHVEAARPAATAMPPIIETGRFTVAGRPRR